MKFTALSVSILLFAASAAQMAAADEHGRPEARAERGPQGRGDQNRGVPGRAGFDGRGQVLD